MDGSGRRAGFPPELGVLALVIAASVPLGRLFQPASPGQPGIGTVQVMTALTSLGVAWGLQRLRVPALLSALVSGCAFLWFAASFFFPDTLAWVFPTPHSFRMLFAALDSGMEVVRVEAAPVEAAAGVLALAAIGIWATTWLVHDAVAGLRHPLLGVGLALPVFAMPGTLLRPAALWVDVGMFCAGALLVLFQDERLRLARWGGGTGHGWRPGLAARLGGAAILLGILAAPILPGYGQPPGGTLRQGRGGAAVTVNPLVSIRPSLRLDPITELFTVTAARSAYWRLTSLDTFDGRSWTPSPEARAIGLRGAVRRTSPSPGAVRVEQRYELAALAAPWIPAAFEPVSISGIRGVSIRPVSRTLLSGGSFRPGMTFTVVSEVPSPTYEALAAAASADPAEDSRYTALPAQTPPLIEEIARQVTAGSSSRLEAVVALQDYLRTFRYDENVRLRHDFRNLVEFLTVVRAGYCEQFAAAMAVMARSLGFPARVSVGFGTGEQIEPGRWTVTSRQAHAWPEVFFPGHGWMAFEPTPRDDGFDVPPHAQAGTESTPPTAVPTPQPTLATTEPSPQPNRNDKEPAPVARETRRSRPLVAPLTGLGVLAVLAAAFPGAAWVKRAVRRRRAARGSAAVSVRYVEFLEWCRAAAVGRRPEETPLEHAGRLGARPRAEAEPVESLAVMATAAVYGSGTRGPAEVRHAAASVRAARRAVAPSVGRARRILPALGWGWWRRADRPGRRAGRGLTPDRADRPGRRAGRGLTPDRADRPGRRRSTRSDAVR